MQSDADVQQITAETVMNVIPRIFACLWLLTIVTACNSQSQLEDRVDESRALFSSEREVSVANPSRFSFAAVGDTHLGSQQTERLRGMLELAKSEGDSFFVFLGDIVDKGTREDMQAFNTASSEVGLPVFAVIGNHDVFGQGWSHYRELLGPSAYTFRAGRSRFIALDTADASLGETQREWLEDQIRASTDMENVFLVSHYLPVVPGIRTYLRLASEVESMKLMKLGSELGVRAWLGAHYHSYVRQNIAGVEYVVAGGGGGRRMHPVTDYFFVRVSVDGTNVSYDIRVVD